MSYIWENYSEDTEYRIAKEMCPYMEVFNRNEMMTGVNPLIRFSEIFSASFEKNDTARFVFDILDEILGKDSVERITDILFHYLAQLDRTKGLDSGQRIMEKIDEEIKRELWGKRAKKLISELTSIDKEHVLYVLSRRIQNDNQSLFMEAIGKTFPVSSLCFEKKTNRYYLFIGAEETDYNIHKFELIKLLFWTINRELLVIWKYHYGIIGCDDTMHIERIQII